MNLKPLKVVDAAGVDRTPSTMKMVAGSRTFDRNAQVMQYLIERLGYTEDRAKSLLSNYS